VNAQANASTSARTFLRWHMKKLIYEKRVIKNRKYSVFVTLYRKIEARNVFQNKT
jgi:hypothetical protein